MQKRRFRCLVTACVLVSSSTPALAQLRIVNYNVAGLNGDLTKLQTVFNSLADDDKPGFAVAPHVYIFQEVQTPDAAINGPLHSRLNASSPGVTYVRATYTSSSGEDSSAGAQALFYRSDTIVEDPAGHLDIPTGAGRNSDRWLLRLVNYTSPQARFYVYSSHLKANNTSADAETRRAGAAAVRLSADGLGADVHIIYAGDWNVYTSNEPAYQTFIAAGAGQAIDPIGGSDWTGGINAIKHTQSPCLSCPSPLVNGGLDDRFDFQLATSAFNDGQGLSRIAGTYRTFGNDGAHYNAALNSGTNSYYPGDPTRSMTIANALVGASDHCPVVCEFQIPARMSAALSPVGGNVGRVIQGAVVAVQLSVSNTASVVVAAGADVLSFSANGAGSVTGTASGSVAALASPALRTFSVSTGSIGAISGSVQGSSSNQAVENPTFTLPVSGSVIRHANASFRSDANEVARSLTRVYRTDTGVRSNGLSVFNRGFDANQALLDIDAIAGLGGRFAGSGAPALNLGAAPAMLNLTFDTASAGNATHNATATIQVSDENLSGATSGAMTVDLTIVTRVLLSDINGDCRVDLTDLAIMLGAFGACSGEPAYSPLADLDNNGCIELTDLSTLLAEFGAACD